MTMTLPMTLQLFLVVLGGRIEGCHIELHDVAGAGGSAAPHR